MQNNLKAGVSESENRESENFFEEFNKTWDFYKGNKRANLEEYPVYSMDKIKQIYQDNFSYLKLMIEMKYTKSNKRISIIAVLVSIIATIISLTALLKEDCGVLIYIYKFFQ